MTDGRDGYVPKDRLTPKEVEKLRAMIPKIEHVIEEDEFAGRFWSTIRKGIYYIAALATGIVLFRENLRALWLWLMK
jgi:hypothetical protein